MGRVGCCQGNKQLREAELCHCLPALYQIPQCHYLEVEVGHQIDRCPKEELTIEFKRYRGSRGRRAMGSGGLRSHVEKPDATVMYEWVVVRY